jgi:hypothetical protein
MCRLGLFIFMQATLYNGVTIKLDDIDQDLLELGWSFYNERVASILDDKPSLLHILIALRAGLVKSAGDCVIFRNDNPRDLRRENLVAVSRSTALLRKSVQSGNRSPYGPGIGYSPEKPACPWRARISSRHLGRFATLEAAVAARRDAEREMLGELAL